MTVKGERLHPADTLNIWIDPQIEEHIADHHVTPCELFEVYENDPVYLPNRRDRSALWLMLGRTDGGRALIAAVTPDEVTELLVPSTAYDCPQHYIVTYQL